MRGNDRSIDWHQSVSRDVFDRVVNDVVSMITLEFPAGLRMPYAIFDKEVFVASWNDRSIYSLLLKQDPTFKDLCFSVTGNLAPRHSGATKDFITKEILAPFNSNVDSKHDPKVQITTTIEVL